MTTMTNIDNINANNSFDSSNDSNCNGLISNSLEVDDNTRLAKHTCQSDKNSTCTLDSVGDDNNDENNNLSGFSELKQAVEQQ